MLLNLRRALATLLALLVATTLGLAVAGEASADVVWTGSAPRSTVIELGELANLPTGVTVVDAQLGACGNNEFCAWTDALNASQPAGLLYRWDISYKGAVVQLGGAFYMSISFIQNRWGNSRARIMTSYPCAVGCPGNAATPWAYGPVTGATGDYFSLGGTPMNDKGKILYSQAL